MPTPASASPAGTVSRLRRTALVTADSSSAEVLCGPVASRMRVPSSSSPLWSMSADSTLVPPRSTASAIVIWSAYRSTHRSYEQTVAQMLQPARHGVSIDVQGGRRMSDDNELLMVRAAELYYDDNKTQDEIGALLGITRWKVGRLLTQARQSGIVRIDIVHPRARRLGLERDLSAQLGLKEPA